MSDEQTDGRRGSVGNEIFDQVEALMSQEGLTRTQAFQRLSETTGRRAGTVAANYYRVARKRGAALQPRKPRARRGSGSATGRRAPRRGGSNSAEAALARASEAIQELATVVRDQQKELATLREKQAEQADRLRNWVKKNM
jgi:hypothetical protein